MNQAEAAEALGISESTVSRYVSGDRVPSLDTMYVIRDVLLWSIEAQAEEVRCGTYAQAFMEKMEKRQTRRRVAEASTVRGVPGTGSGGGGVPALETGEQDGQEGGMGKGPGALYRPGDRWYPR